MRYRPGNKPVIVLIAMGMFMAGGCSSRSADDQVRPQTPLQPATPVAAMPTHFVAVTVPRERYILRGNTLYVGRGSEVVYVVPQGATDSAALAQLRDQDLNLNAYLNQLKTDQEILRDTIGSPVTQTQDAHGAAPLREVPPNPQRGLRRAPPVEALPDADAAPNATRDASPRAPTDAALGAP